MTKIQNSPMSHFYNWKVALLSILLIISQNIAAQTFYELIYNDLNGKEAHGLMFYVDDQNCHLRLWNYVGKEHTLNAYDYITAKADENDEANYTIMASDSDNSPILIWLWDEDESEERQLVPYISFDEDDEPEDWVRAESFVEIPLTLLKPSYLNQFYTDEEDFYKQVCEAHYEALQSERETAQEGAAEEIEAAEAEVAEKGSSMSVSSRPVLHLFVVANTEVADIGSACRTDYNNITNEMQGISRSLGLPMKKYFVTGQNYSKAALRQQLANLKPKPNDIVFFLYTGHGFRFDNQKDVFPLMALTTNDYQPLDGNYVALSDVYNEICKKGARLNIVLSDCCNSKIGEVRPLQGNTLFSRGNNNFSRKRLADLFYNAKGSILSTAASPGEYSWCDAAGGMFTLSFIQSLRKEISAMNNRAVSWQSIVDNTLKTALSRSSNAAKAQNGLKKMQMTKI